MFRPDQKNAFVAGVLLLVASCFPVLADSWSPWAHVFTISGAAPRLATDGTNMFYTTLLDGVYRATLADRNFSLMPMTGFPLWDANTNTNGFAVANIATTPQGTIVISGSQVNVASNTIFFNPLGSSSNTRPVFYWWDESNQLWQAASVSNKSYPYTGNVGNFSVAPDGSLWTCSGFATYVYHSTNGGRSYTAIDINAHVPTNYFPIPGTPQMTLGEVFSILVTPQNEIIIGTESGSFLHSTNNGASWLSLDPNYTNTNTLSPLGRVGDARVAGFDRQGNVLLNNYQLGQFPGRTNWNNVSLIAWRPKDGTYFPATNGFLASLGSGRVFTPPSGVSFLYMSQNYLLQGGMYRSPDGKSWTQFNEGSGLDFPFAPGLTNVLGAGGCITMLGNVIYIGVGNSIYSYDSTPPPVVNRPPVALAQAANLWENSPTNLVLTGSDADGNALNFTIVAPPKLGTLTGMPPDLVYTPTNHFTGLDEFTFVADDGVATSAPAIFNLAVNPTTNPPPAIAFTTTPPNGSGVVAPTNLILSASVSDNDGFVRVNFYDGVTLLTAITSAPYVVVVTNPIAGDHVFFARAVDKFNARTWAQPSAISVLPLVPRLQIQPADAQNIAVTWPLDLDGFYLESAADPAGPWTLCPVPPLFYTNGQTATIPMADQQFFRLMHPH